METDPLATSSLLDLGQKIQTGDRQAFDILVRRTCDRLEQLTRRMLRQYPVVHRWEQTDDVFQNAVLRLGRALKTITPGSVREFFGLAAEQVRRELIDLSRRYRRRPMSDLPTPSDDASLPGFDPPAPEEAASEVERWEGFHEAVDQLPVREREVVGLVFYHGWTQNQVAELLGLSERQIRRIWVQACAKLGEVLGDSVPEM